MPNAYSLLATNSYLHDMERLPDEVRCGQLPETHARLAENPRHPGLGSEECRGINSRQVFRSRVDLYYRMAWWYTPEREIVLWRVGTHQLIDLLDDPDSFPKPVRRLAPAAPSEADAAETREYAFPPRKPPAIFGAFPRNHLRLLGVPEESIDAVLRVTDIEDVHDLGLPSYAVQILTEAYLLGDCSGNQLVDSCYILYRASVDQLEAYCKGHVKQLMLELAPEQRGLVDMRTSGPTLIKGVAGSGKTTIGVYRAIAQAEQQTLFTTRRRILFLTFTKTLARVVTDLFRELRADRAPLVEVAVLGDWSQAYLAESDGGGSRKMDTLAARQCLTQAMAEVRRLTPRDQILMRGDGFFASEISDVIKGRGLRTWEAYRDANRVGRGSPLQEGQRRFVWAVYEALQRRLHEAGVMDYADLAPEVIARLAAQPDREPYDEVIVDEAQDLRPVDLQVAAALAGGGRSHGLIFLVDPKQSIYYRGLAWKDGGVEVAARRVFSLRRNFRNTRPILDAAWSVARAETYKPFDDEVIQPSASDRPGPLPVVVVCPNLDLEISAARDIVLDLCERQLYRPGDIAILAHLNETVNAIRQRLETASVPVVHFRDEHFDIFENQVKVITIHSAKGLEFPVVILVGLDEDVLPRKLTGLPDEDRLAELRIERQLMYVGMTRACQRLYMTCTAGKPSRFLTDIAEGLVRVRAPGQVVAADS